jgi:ATP synthase subunit 6
MHFHILQLLSIKGNFYYPLIINLLIFILFNNLLGLIPYSFTSTSQIIITLLLSVSIIIGVTIIGIIKHKFKFIYLFIPKGLSIFITPIISFIEIISYLSRVISLSIRLTANMVAGHTILTIISSFGLYFSLSFNIFFLIPLLLIILILEIGVAIIQAYVFAILTTTYIKDSLFLH